MPRITRNSTCALYAAGIIRSNSQTVICFFIRHLGGRRSFHLTAPIFDANQIVLNALLHLNILLRTAPSANFRGEKGEIFSGI